MSIGDNLGTNTLFINTCIMRKSPEGRHKKEREKRIRKQRENVR